MIHIFTRADTASVLLSLGFLLDIDFVAKAVSGGVEVNWLSQASLPDDTTVAAYDLTPETVASRANVLARANADDALTNDRSSDRKIDRGVGLATNDAINQTNTRVNQLFAAIAAATSLANLQTRVAALSTLPIRTDADVLIAVKSRIDSGTGVD